jgi:cation-transporting ATPase 13A3/4/5
MDSLVNGLELITICVPPTLPTALGAGIHLAVERLEKQKILCVKPDKVNVAGKVNLSLFDKTGTLTELGLDVLGCVDKEGKLLKINEANH